MNWYQRSAVFKAEYLRNKPVSVARVKHFCSICKDWILPKERFHTARWGKVAHEKCVDKVFDWKFPK